MLVVVIAEHSPVEDVHSEDGKDENQEEKEAQDVDQVDE